MHSPHASTPLQPLPSPELTDPAFRPTSFRDLLLPHTHKRVLAWFRNASREWTACAKGSQRRFLTPPLFIHQLDLAPGARGVVWDLRDGPPSPVSSSTRACRPPILNTNRISEFMNRHSYPDQALHAELAEGWRGHSDSTPLITILALPSSAFVTNMDRALPSVRQDIGSNLASLFPARRGLPFIPARLLPMGSAPKSRSD